MDIPKAIKDARKRAKLSQSQAAARWGVGVRNLQHWEQGRLPDAENLLKLLPHIARVKTKRN